ncbi:hypothetical protein SAICODRAFT_72195 [Saitoella complicata NRRL Y-17804]|uniref:Uncharacterized protein n=1 Tax=Saitoella complicata (strain BCRC 22490 / CBS 7301 / JCM 7358 / NBRC 10748 / NRRL Y-17804) TaxID=698492 RepID=A0A0E9NFU0_SAICN|nr:uncharacterized protein SAICODRAFT_72195 [Saitoella complicata NRRL Y-17804]ODQ51904.1 hypothetical protein SAICODRAFT_72195 [Saitoella complicata NRRL Y-17804]GAO48704.1 hypothetical protein G7K_2874-t1 [Saitoella complicata NRRL Y-17804]
MTFNFSTPFQIQAWAEDRTQTLLPRITPAQVTYSLPSLRALIKTTYLMTYRPDGNASFVFAETVEAEDFQGRRGLFITQGTGQFELNPYRAWGTFEVVKGTGMDGLAGIEGRGSFDTVPERVYHFEVDLDDMVEE